MCKIGVEFDKCWILGVGVLKIKYREVGEKLK